MKIEIRDNSSETRCMLKCSMISWICSAATTPRPFSLKIFSFGNLQELDLTKPWQQ